MDGSALRLVAITDLNDDRLLPWLTLYELSFPPPERMLVADLLATVKRSTATASTDASVTERLMSVVDETEEFLGLVHYEIVTAQPVAALWYFAIEPARRSQGLGATIYQRLVADLSNQSVSALFLEVEIPEETDSPAHRRLAERRIAFYQRQGARLMDGIRHIQSVGPHQPTIPMHVMVHPLVPLSGDAAFELARLVFPQSIEAVGPVTLQ